MIKKIWTKEIKRDYKTGWLLKEDTLKNALYFHLRNELGVLFAENNIRIFTEFTDDKFKNTGYRPDMVIAEMDLDKEDGTYYGDDVKECLAVIEIKFKTKNGADTISADYDKLEAYISKLNVNAHLYMATIWEEFDEPTTWIRKNAAWAKDKVTELNASYIKNSDYQTQFYVCEH